MTSPPAWPRWSPPCPRSTGCGSRTRRCSQENQRLTTENARLDEIRRENESLTGLLQLKAGVDFQTTAATVIARESSEFRRLVVLDRGTNDGIAVGDVAIAAGGALAGRVVEVGPDSAKVVLVSDSSSTVIGQLTTNAATGQVVGGLDDGVLVMSQIDSSEKVTVGDEVVTAGIELGGGIRSPYPKGLLLGQVIDVRRDANDVVQTAYLQPAANLDKLEYVLVILDYQGGLPPIEEQPVPCPDQNGNVAAGRAAVLQPEPQPIAERRAEPEAERVAQSLALTPGAPIPVAQQARGSPCRPTRHPVRERRMIGRLRGCGADQVRRPDRGYALDQAGGPPAT